MKTASLRIILNCHRNLRCHRYRIVEGIREVAYRNMGELHRAVDQVGLKTWFDHDGIPRADRAGLFSGKISKR